MGGRRGLQPSLAGAAEQCFLHSNVHAGADSVGLGLGLKVCMSTSFREMLMLVTHRLYSDWQGLEHSKSSHGLLGIPVLRLSCGPLGSKKMDKKDKK